jgi:hypothetical protein
MLRLLVLASIDWYYSHRLAEVGALLCMIGGFLLAGAGVRPSLQKWGLVAGGLTLAVGCAVLIIVMHWGESPFVNR